MIRRLLRRLLPPVQRVSRETQILLANQYRAQDTVLPFADVEFSAYSQNGEDGMLWYLFTVLGTTNRTVLELGCGDGIECNSANLVANHGWRGLLIDGDIRNIKRGRTFYAQRTTPAFQLRRLPPTLVDAWIEPDTVNHLVTSQGVSGEIDLLSLDVDGMDYWIWKGLTGVSPRVVILEYNNRWPADQAVTVPYEQGLAGSASIDSVGHFGASLKAFAHLGGQKGYRLVGANSPNTNAVFLRHDVGMEKFPAVTVESCLSSAYARYQCERFSSALARLPTVDVLADPNPGRIA